MTRFVVVAGDQYITAVYAPDGNGIGFTALKEDAGSWSTYERAVAAARIVAKCTGTPAFVHSVDEPSYPRSWFKAA